MREVTAAERVILINKYQREGMTYRQAVQMVRKTYPHDAADPNTMNSIKEYK